jgi:hypothetical protein
MAQWILTYQVLLVMVRWVTEYSFSASSAKVVGQESEETVPSP